jgi:hypothetical protein
LAGITTRKCREKTSSGFNPPVKHPAGGLFGCDETLQPVSNLFFFASVDHETAELHFDLLIYPVVRRFS